MKNLVIGVILGVALLLLIGCTPEELAKESNKKCETFVVCQIKTVTLRYNDKPVVPIVVDYRNISDAKKFYSNDCKDVGKIISESSNISTSNTGVTTFYTRYIVQ